MSVDADVDVNIMVEVKNETHTNYNKAETSVHCDTDTVVGVARHGSPGGGVTTICMFLQLEAQLLESVFMPVSTAKIIL